MSYVPVPLTIEYKEMPTEIDPHHNYVDRTAMIEQLKAEEKMKHPKNRHERRKEAVLNKRHVVIGIETREGI